MLSASDALTMILIHEDGRHFFRNRFVFPLERLTDERHGLKRAMYFHTSVDALKRRRRHDRQSHWDRLNDCLGQRGAWCVTGKTTHSGSLPCRHLSLPAIRQPCLPAASRPIRPARRARYPSSPCLWGCRRLAELGLRTWRAISYAEDTV